MSLMYNRNKLISYAVSHVWFYLDLKLSLNKDTVSSRNGLVVLEMLSPDSVYVHFIQTFF